MEDARLVKPDSANGIRVLYLAGKPYQMGYQHGFLCADEIEAYRQNLEADTLWAMAISMARTMSPEGPDAESSYIDYAVANSLPFVIEECEGMVRNTNAFTRNECVAMNSLLYLFEDMIPRYLPGMVDALSCSQFAVVGSGSADGKLVHGRNMDWLAIDFIMDHPTLIVRRPEGGLAHVSLMWPSMIASLSGINEAGLVIANDEIACAEGHRDLTGVPPMQLLTQVLSEAHDIEEAVAIIEASDHASCEVFMLSHGPSRRAAVVEKSASAVRVRPMGDDQQVFMTNHFMHPDMLPQLAGEFDPTNLEDSSVARYTRLSERLTGLSLAPHPDLAPAAADFAFGRIDVPMAIDILRDPLDMRPDSDRCCFTCDNYQDGGWSLGNNHNVQAMVFMPEDMQLWLATGWDEECTNSIYSPFVGFDVRDLLDGHVDPSRVPDYDPDYNPSHGNGIHPDG